MLLARLRVRKNHSWGCRVFFRAPSA
jgi:hypothetical protein